MQQARAVFCERYEPAVQRGSSGLCNAFDHSLVHGADDRLVARGGRKEWAAAQADGVDLGVSVVRLHLIGCEALLAHDVDHDAARNAFSCSLVSRPVIVSLTLCYESGSPCDPRATCLSERVIHSVGESIGQRHGETGIRAQLRRFDAAPTPGRTPSADRVLAFASQESVGPQLFEVPANGVLMQAGDLDELDRRGAGTRFQFTQQSLARRRMLPPRRGAPAILAFRRNNFHGINYS